MKMDKVIDGIIARVPKPIEDTYIDDDGFLRCKKCGGKRQSILKYKDRESRVPCICECHQAAIKAEKEAEKQRDKMNRINELKRTGFSYSELCKCTFENADQNPAKVFHIAKKYVENFEELKKSGKGLLFYGECGTGKTYIAACIANALMDKGTPAMMTNFNRISNKLQESFDGKQAYLDSLNKLDLLVIDDLAAERKTEYMQEVIFNVIDARYRAGLPMIFTSNLALKDIKNPQGNFEKRIYDRILEKCFPIELKGDSHRRKNLKDDFENMKGLLGLN